jgi:hypothetical protein
MSAEYAAHHARERRHGDPHVDDLQRDALATREHAGGRAAPHEVGHHGGGHLAGIGADTVTRDRVLGREEQAGGRARLRDGGALDARQLDGQLLEAPERERRLGERGLTETSGLHGGGSSGAGMPASCATRLGASTLALVIITAAASAR